MTRGTSRRVVRPGGLVAIAAISRFASLFDGLSQGVVFEAEFRAIEAEPSLLGLSSHLIAVARADSR